MNRLWKEVITTKLFKKEKYTFFIIKVENMFQKTDFDIIMDISPY